MTTKSRYSVTNLLKITGRAFYIDVISDSKSILFSISKKELKRGLMDAGITEFFVAVGDVVVVVFL